MDMWSYRVEQPSDVAIAGYDVEAVDGSIGKVERTPSFSAGQQALAVDTGFWILGQRRLLPAGVVDRIDPTEQKVYVNLTKAQIKDAPDWNRKAWDKASQLSEVGDYYASSGRP
jgi:hypothetical protein